MATGSDSTITETADRNREKRLKARRALEKLMAMAEGSDFSGSVTVEISVEQGCFGRIRLATNAYER
jgi:hypothetical protein